MRWLITIAAKRQIPAFMLWRSAAVKYGEIEKRLGTSRYAKIRSLLSQADLAHLAISDRTAKETSETLGLDLTACVYNCQRIPEKYLEPVVPQDPPLVLNVGNVNAKKAPDFFMGVAEIVCHSFADVKFLWVGGKPPIEIESRIAELGLEDRIAFEDFSDNPFEHMQRASVFFLSSRQEAFGLVQAEAMGCSRTVLCFEGTGAAEVGGESGITVPYGDLESAASEILKIIRRPSHERLNLDARARYEKMFSPAAYAARFSQIIRKRVTSGKHKL